MITMQSLKKSPTTFTAVVFNKTFKIPYTPFEPRFVLELIFLSVILVAPAAFYEYSRYRLLYRIEDQLPVVTRIIADALRTGTVIEDAIQLIARSGISPMNKILGRALVLSRYRSIPITESIRIVGNSIGAEQLVRFADLIELAYRYGARAEEILEVAASTMESIQTYRRERMVNLRPYVALIYMIVFIYLFICGIIAVLSALHITNPMGHVKMSINETTLNMMLSVVEYMTLINVAGASLVIGRIVYERPLAGLIHYVILAPTTYFTLIVMKIFLVKILVPGAV